MLRWMNRHAGTRRRMHAGHLHHAFPPPNAAWRRPDLSRFSDSARSAPPSSRLQDQRDDDRPWTVIESHARWTGVVPFEPPFDVAREANVVAIRVDVAAKNVDKALEFMPEGKAGTAPRRRTTKHERELTALRFLRCGGNGRLRISARGLRLRPLRCFVESPRPKQSRFSVRRPRSGLPSRSSPMRPQDGWVFGTISATGWSRLYRVASRECSRDDVQDPANGRIRRGSSSSTRPAMPPNVAATARTCESCAG